MRPLSYIKTLPSLRGAVGDAAIHLSAGSRLEIDCRPRFREGRLPRNDGNLLARIQQGFLFTLLFALVTFNWQQAARAEVKIQTVTGGGVTAWLVEDYHVPAINVSLSFRDAGTASDSPEFSGRAHLLAEMLLKGTKTLDDEAFENSLENKAIELSADASRDAISIHMKTLAEHKETAFALMAQAFAQPRFDVANLNESKAQVKSLLRRYQETPNYRADRVWNKLAYGIHPYANPPLGTVAGIDAVTAEELERFRSHSLTKSNLVIGVVGAIDADSLETLLTKNFADLPEQFAADQPVTDTSLPMEGKQEDITMDVPQSVILFGLPGIARNDPRFYAAYVLNEMLGGQGLSSRLSEIVRRAHGLTYGISTDLDSGVHSAAWKGGFATRTAEAEQAINIMKQTVQEMADKGATQQELALSVDYITGSFPLNLDNNSSIAEYLIAMQIYNLGEDYLEKRNDYFRAVTLEQVNQAAHDLLDTNRMILVRVGAKPAKTPPKDQKTK